MAVPRESQVSAGFVGPDEGEWLRAGPVLHRILEDGGATDGRLGLVECRMPPGWPGPPQHVHRAHDETFFVLTGHVRVTSGGATQVLPAGGLFAAGIGIPHTFGNADPDEPASLLLTVTPERYVGYFRDLARLRPGADGLLDPAEIRGLMSRYATVPHLA
jgi:mannose-6-phosphate isomerase-like protein (cupin superfamily)